MKGLQVQKKFFSGIIAASALAMAAGHAAAAEYDINLSGISSAQVQTGDVTQAALSAAAAVGTTGNDVDISSTAVNAAQIANVSSDVSQSVDGTVNGNGQLALVGQSVEGAVTQASASIAGSGDLGAGSSITSLAANLGQSASVSLKVTQ